MSEQGEREWSCLGEKSQCCVCHLFPSRSYIRLFSLDTYSLSSLFRNCCNEGTLLASSSGERERGKGKKLQFVFVFILPPCRTVAVLLPPHTHISQSSKSLSKQGVFVYVRAPSCNRKRILFHLPVCCNHQNTTLSSSSFSLSLSRSDESFPHFLDSGVCQC